MTPDEIKQQEQEELKQTPEEPKDESPKDNQEEEDLFDPFATIKEDEEQPKKEIKKEEPKKEDEEQPKQEDSFGVQYQADKEARRVVAKFIQENPEHAELKDDLEELASSAIQRKHSKPLEFALRNVRPTKYWIEKGREEGRVAVENAQNTRIGGNVGGNRGGGATPDYSKMPSDQFNKMLANLTRR